MRIHSDTLTADDLRAAAKVADMTFETFGEGISRSRKRGFTVLASGNSTRNAMSNDFKAATWDQWGVFLGILFELDEDMHTGANGYANEADFHYKTNWRFTPATRDAVSVTSSHGHRWNYVSPYHFECKTVGCTAEVRFK